MSFLSHLKKLLLKLANKLRKAPATPTHFTGYPNCVLIPDELTLISKMSDSAMANVWKAYNQKRKKEVVVKIPVHNNPLLVSLLTSEVNATQHLKYPHIVEVYGMGQSNGVLFIEEELLVGKNFADWLAEQSHHCFPWHDIKDYAVQVGRALAYAHLNNIFHCDVKPSNIMRVDIPGQPSIAKLIDFGIASRSHIADNRPAFVVGAHSLAYASPDQIGGIPADASDDVYGFCATFYELLTGCTPFEGIPGDLEDNIRYTPVPDPNERLAASKVGFSIPKEIAQALLLGLNKDRHGPHRRPSDILTIVRLMESEVTRTVLVNPGGRWENGRRDQVRLASSGLIVIECLRESLALDDFLKKEELAVNVKPHVWDGEIIRKIHDRSLDAAVLNAWLVRQFQETQPSNQIEIVCSCRRSMNGECFYLMGLTSAHKSPIGFSDLKAALINNTIVVNDLPEHKQAIEVLMSSLMSKDEQAKVRIEVIDPVYVVQTLQREPRGLVYCGQNFRLMARQSDDFVEVVSYETCPEELKAKLAKLTENYLVVNRAFGKCVQVDKLKAHCERAQNAFAHKCKKTKGRKDVVERISRLIRDYQFNEVEIQDAIHTALIKTFPP